VGCGVGTWLGEIGGPIGDLVVGEEEEGSDVGGFVEPSSIGEVEGSLVGALEGDWLGRDEGA
jgi:hypothetical protein